VPGDTGLVKRPKLINVYRTNRGSTLYSGVCIVALGLCVINVPKRSSLKITDTGYWKEAQLDADADKPARRV